MNVKISVSRVMIPVIIFIFTAAAVVSEPAVAVERTSLDQKSVLPIPKTSFSVSITGVSTKPSAKADSKIADNVKVSTSSPAESCILELQQYDSKHKKWKNRTRYKVPENGKVKVSYPKKYRKKTTGNWRMHVSAAGRDGKLVNAEAFSKKITLTSRNIKPVSLSSKSACIYNATDRVILYDKKMNTKRKQASTTKLMTALIILNENRPGEKVRITSKAAADDLQNSQRLGLKSGDRYYLKDLMNALLVSSSNGSADALAQHNAGSVTGFAKKMNRKAKQLGLSHTHYKNPHGLDSKGHYSSAKDTAKLAAEVYRNRAFRKTVKKKRCVVRNVNGGKKKTLKSSDELLGWSKYFKGGKTGYTEGAGGCFAGIYEYKGKVYVITNLGASPKNNRFSDNKKLFDYVKKYARSRY